MNLLDRHVKAIILSLLIVFTIPFMEWRKESSINSSSDQGDFMISRSAHPLRGAEDQYGWDFLRDFQLVPESVALIGEKYIIALFENPDGGLYAIVMFTVDCSGSSCGIGELVAYSVFDAGDTDKQLV